MFGEVWCPSRGKRPYIIITNGLMGSGKSSLVDKVVDQYALCLNNQTFRIDDLIQTNTAYKQSIDRLIEGYCTTRTLCDNLKQSLASPSLELYKEFGELYFYHRGKGKSCDGMSYDDFLESRLQDAIQTHQNIVFETVGLSYAEWLINMVKPTHEVYYAFTLMDFQTMIKRNRSRALQQTRQYLSNPHRPAPRLPDLSFQHFRNSTKAVNDTLKHLLTKHGGGVRPGNMWWCLTIRLKLPTCSMIPPTHIRPGIWTFYCRGSRIYRRYRPASRGHRPVSNHLQSSANVSVGSVGYSAVYVTGWFIPGS